MFQTLFHGPPNQNTVSGKNEKVFFQNGGSIDFKTVILKSWDYVRSPKSTHVIKTINIFKSKEKLDLI
jgi:hypothetical protein